MIQQHVTMSPDPASRVKRLSGYSRTEFLHLVFLSRKHRAQVKRKGERKYQRDEVSTCSASAAAEVDATVATLVPEVE